MNILLTIGHTLILQFLVLDLSQGVIHFQPSLTIMYHLYIIKYKINSSY